MPCPDVANLRGGVQRSLTCATIGATRILALALCCWALPGWAEPPKSISLELNKLEQEGGSCRAYLVIANPGTDAFSAFTLDFVVFDNSGTIARRLAIELAPMRPAKTIVKVFDIPDGVQRYRQHPCQRRDALPGRQRRPRRLRRPDKHFFKTTGCAVEVNGGATYA